MMKNITITSITLLLISVLFSCSDKSDNMVDVSQENLEVINRAIIPSTDETSNTLVLDAKQGAGMAMLKTIIFDTGTIELDLKGENNPGRSFVGIAFNIQNDSTYESIYFRPFNFQSDEQIRREHSVQYVSEPTNNWRYLRTNFEGQYEAEYPRKPSPDDWFSVRIKVDPTTVSVYDTKTNTELLQVKRIEKYKSGKMGLWVGNNSKGAFKNLQISQ